jgi:TRAP-type C4-dicarboxylate transport system permease small subunit
MDRVASVVLFLMMLLTMADVILRKLYSKSIMGTVELTEFMLVILIFFALAHAEVLNKHVRIDLVMGRFSGRTQGIVDMVTQGICFALSLMMTWSALDYTHMMRASGEVSQDLWMPVFPFIYVMAFGLFILSLALLINFMVSIEKAVRS